jgi:signal transduction histidine kinase
MARRSTAKTKPATRLAFRSGPSAQRLAAVPRTTPEESHDDRFFRQMVFNLSNGVLAITRSGHIAAMNDHAYRVLGLTPHPGDVGRPFPEVLSGVPEVARVLHSAFEADDLPNRAEMRLRKTGKAIGYTLSRIHDDEGRQVGATLFCKDLTRVEQLEERERLRDRLAALGEMAAAIAHEVKNPLASIEVMAGVLRRQLKDRPEALETLGDIIKEAKMANAIVVEVLEFVRPIQLQVERVPLVELLKESITAAEGKMVRGNTSIQLTVDRDVPELLADPYQLRQLFANLLMNALEALNGDGQIEIRARLAPVEEEGPVAAGQIDPPAPSIVIDVRDSGPGISPDDLERVFSPFFTTKPQGSGLGLAIVRKVVDAHDGRIDATSVPGRTTFSVTLPVVPPFRPTEGDK